MTADRLPDEALKEIEREEMAATQTAGLARLRLHVRKLARIAREEHEQVITLQKEQMDCDEAHLADGEQMRQQRVELTALRERAEKAEGERDLYAKAAKDEENNYHEALKGWKADVEKERAENVRLRGALTKAEGDIARMEKALKRRECPFDHAVMAANAVALCVHCGAALRGGEAKDGE